MKLTKTQKAYLRSAYASPMGRTVIYGKTLAIMVDAGVVIHKGLGIAEITEAGRAALKENGE